MSQTIRKILVPTDFSAVAVNALDHAITLAQHSEAEVFLLHVVGKQSDVEDARKQLDAIIGNASSKAGSVRLNKLVRVGSIYEDIGDAAAEIDASLIVMGTHGMRGMQFLTGSRALRVITSSPVPFIVVQERSIKANGYDSIVVPLDLHKETRQKLTMVADMAKYFNSKVHLITPRENDEFLHKQLVNHIKFANQYLDERGIAHDATIADEDSGDFVKAVVRHAVKLDADLIAIMNLAQGNIFGVLGVPYEQEVLTNEAHIPVMCMNPRETTVGGGWTMQG
ncbi:MAG: universal stress protein [Flavobacteriales bacterium]|jgi:nucleotide-binding universal stress UspA family protein|nr:universal stress protein [Flavobacteriales bacterium]MBK9513569.1 universal stress protein [Flavobacteriales bacterium]MBP7448470.1 universal stress protein [Flavobacteriales bacterium]HOZ40899.1 universal stress protein [Flavobacteriales bacterium]